MLLHSELEMAWQALYAMRAAIKAGTTNAEDRAKCADITGTMRALTQITIDRRDRIETIRNEVARSSGSLDDLRAELVRLERAEAC